MRLAERTFRRIDYTKPVGRSLYGYRINPVTKKEQFHYGEDYSTHGENWDIYALEYGVVRQVGFNDLSGNFVQVDYPRIDLRLFYAHCDIVFVKLGQIVNGEVIAKVGTTGSSTGEHLHLGVRRISTNEYFNHATFDYQEFYINGIWNKQFTRDIQFYYKVHFDKSLVIDGVSSGQRAKRQNIEKVTYGFNGSMWVKVLQNVLGIKQTGQLDKVTIYALQQACGIYSDGFISPVSWTVRKLQINMSKGFLI